jgi:uncharacterized protein
MSSATASPSQPSAQQRSLEIDVLRGFALLGIVVVNAPFFAYPLTALPPVSTMADVASVWLTNTVASGKFFLIFSFLFGHGMAVIAARLEAEHPRRSSPYWRRLGGLFVFGALHAVFLFAGDILMLYAVLGTGLWFARNWSMRRLLLAAASCYLLAVIGQSAIVTAVVLDGAAVRLPDLIAISGYPGDFFEAMRQRLADLPQAMTFITFFNGPAAMSAMLLGVAAHRRGLFTSPNVTLRAAARHVMPTAVLALVGSGVAVAVLLSELAGGPGPRVGLVALAAAGVGLLAPLISLALGLVVILSVRRWRNHHGLQALAALGSSSLSGYILHSVLLGGIFMGWGFGLFGRVGPAVVLGLSLLVYAAIIALLVIWKRWFLHGPDEWLLRSFADLRWKPLLRQR